MMRRYFFNAECEMWAHFSHSAPGVWHNPTLISTKKHGFNSKHRLESIFSFAINSIQIQCIVFELQIFPYRKWEFCRIQYGCHCHGNGSHDPFVTSWLCMGESTLHKINYIHNWHLTNILLWKLLFEKNVVVIYLKHLRTTHIYLLLSE